MKKIVLVFSLVLAYSGVMAQLEGTVVFGISLPDMGENSAMMAEMMPSECTLLIGKNKTRMEMKMGMGMQNVTIVDKKTKEVVSLIDMMGNKMALVMTENDLKSKEKSTFKLKTADAGDKLDIAGYSCKHAIYEDKDGSKFDVFYTDAFGDENYASGPENPFKELKGMLLKYTIAQKGMKMTMTAKSITKEKIDDSKFVIPTDYKRMTQAEMQKAFGGMGN